jgi:hypothetical protein
VGAASNQFDESGGTFGNISTLYSYIYIKSDTLGTLNWGHLSPASDNPAVLADTSGTVIESNGVFFEGASFLLRPGGGKGLGGLSGLAWEDFLLCQGLGAGIGVDCWGAAQPAVRYDSPTWGGFRFETSWGKVSNTVPGGLVDSTTDANFADIAVFYTADWNSIKVSLAGAYTWIETGVITGEETDLWQVGGSIMHKPSGLGVYAMGQWEDSSGSQVGAIGISSVTLDSLTFSNPPGPGNANLNIDLLFAGGNIPVASFANPDTDAWYIKPFWRKAWSPIGATVLYGEYGQYNDQFAAGTNLCELTAGDAGTLGSFCSDFALGTGFLTASAVPGGVLKGAFVTGSEVERWGLGAVQEIDSAAMHLWARWQHQELDVNITGYTLTGGGCLGGLISSNCQVQSQKIKQNFDDWDLFQIGGIIFF